MRDDWYIEPTDDERANGWTRETLTEYVLEQQRRQESVVDPKLRPVMRPKVARSKYNPHYWRG